jgi:hypothetical protein
MGGKSAPKMPPPPPAVDTSLQDRQKEEEAKLERAKDKMLASKRQGQYGTILTSGKGVEEEAATAKTLLGGSSKSAYS